MSIRLVNCELYQETEAPPSSYLPANITYKAPSSPMPRPGDIYYKAKYGSGTEELTTYDSTWNIVPDSSREAQFAYRYNGRLIIDGVTMFGYTGQSSYAPYNWTAVDGAIITFSRYHDSSSLTFESTQIEIVTQPTPQGYTLSYSTDHGTAPSSVSDVTELTSAMLPTLEAQEFIWSGNNSLSFTDVADLFDLSFKDKNGVQYDSITVNELYNNLIYWSDGEDTDAYINDSWKNDAYKTISVVGGNDIANPTLYNWLAANGTITPTYTFQGWYYESTFTTQAQAGDTISADTTLYAKWEEQTSTTLSVTYNSTKIIDSLSVTPPITVTYNGSTIATLNEGDTKTLDILGTDNLPKILATPIVIGGKTISDVDALGRKWVLEHNLIVEVGGSAPTGGNLGDK